MEKYRILLCDDHVLVRRGLRCLLAIHLYDEVEVVGEASDGFECLELLKKTSPDLILMDISMPNLRGLEATREVKIIAPRTKVLIVTMHKDKEYLYQAFSAGAEGYLLKEDSDSELISAIKTIRNGGTYISPLLSSQVADLFMRKIHPTEEGPKDSQALLTTREREIIKLIAEGKSSKETADALHVSSRTIQHHRANIMRKLNIKKTADIVKFAIQKGYTGPES